MGVGSMGALYIGMSGLTVNQAALNATTHNIANLDSNGYTRQQVLMKDTYYYNYNLRTVGNSQSGLGSNMSRIRQVRDFFADSQYRLETGRGSFYSAMHEVEEEVEKYFGTDVDEQPLKNAMTTFWNTINELQKTPDSIVNRETVIQAAQEMIEEAKMIYNQITDYQKNINRQIRDKVDRVNEIADEIHELNKKITMIEGNKLESANDARDRRNYLLDELSGYADITYKEMDSGCVTVNLEGTTLVAEDRVFKLGTMPISERSELLDVVWADHGNMPLYHFSTLPSAANQTDVGSIKGLLFARGSDIGNYTYMFEGSVDLSRFVDGNGNPKYQTLADMYAGEGYSGYGDYYADYVHPFLVTNLETEMDYLMHNIVTAINDILCPNTTTTSAITATDANGNTVTIPAGTTVLDTENAPIGLGYDGEPGQELFTRRSTDRYTVYDYVDNGVNKKLYVYNEEDLKDPITQYSINELVVNEVLTKNPSKMPLSDTDHSNAQDVLNSLLDAWSCEGDYAGELKLLTPDTLTGYDFQGYYNAMINELSNTGNSYYNIALNQEMVANQIDNRRQIVAGVSSDEELSNMIMFQQGYNAASRYINVVADMLDTLVNRLGRG